jgi:uncharacterized membrane protein
MRKNIIVLIVLIFLFINLFSFSSSTTYLNIYLDERGNAMFLGKTNESSLPLPESISVKDGNVIGKTDNLTYKEYDRWTFTLNLSDSEIELVLPTKATVLSASSSEIVFRDDHVSIYSKNSASVTYIINKDYSLLSIMIFSAFVVLLILMIVLKYVLPKKQSHHHSAYKDILNEREKTILSNLEMSGKIKMSYLRKMSGIPKASFSRHVQELEKKKLLKRSGIGKNKFVELIK